MAYIEKEPLCAYLENMGVSAYIIDTIKNEEHFPTADVEEVVRCENCKHIKVANSPTVYARCKKTKFLFEPFQTDTRTHFCSFGERRGDDNET